MTLRYATLPETWEAAKPVLDELLRDHHTALDRAFVWRERAQVVEVRVDTATLPITFDVPAGKPLAVFLLSAVIQDSADGAFISGGSVTWRWRAGRVVVSALSGLASTTKYICTFAITR